VPVLANDVNPFPDTPLTIVSAAVQTGNGSATVSGSDVVVTPDATFVGVMVVSYTVQDATNDPDRQASADIRVTVQGRPDAPATPTVTSIQDRTVVLNWSPPVDNGAVITGYTVSSPQGYSKQCASTTCTLDGLTNDVEYTFTVTATNSVGTSDPSPSSAIARPDARPAQPAPPTLVFGDKSLTVDWVTPATTGSAVQSFNLEISPAPARGAPSRYGVTGNSIVWEGLENGTAYQVRVQAVNKAPEPSDFSAFSATMIPAGKPDTPGAPTTTPATPVGSQAQIKVSWDAPAANGDAISSYQLQTLRGGDEVSTQTVGGTSANVSVDVSETDYTFRVSAHNKAGDSEFGSPSSGRRAAVPPSAPTNVSAAPTGANGTVALSFTPGSTNGSRGDEVQYQYRVDQSGATGAIAPGGGQIGGLSNGTDYTFTVWAVSAVEGVQPGPGTQSNAANPYGPVGAPIVSASENARSVTFSWAPPAANGRPITAMYIQVDGGARQPADPNGGSVEVGDGYDQAHTIVVTAVDSEGQEASTPADGRSKPEPIDTAVTLSKGGPAAGEQDCVGSACRYVRVAISSGAPNATYRIDYKSNRDSGTWLSFTLSTDGAGNAAVTRGYWGYGGNEVWAIASGPDGSFESNHIPW
jgi:hypothetical protein